MYIIYYIYIFIIIFITILTRICFMIFSTFKTERVQAAFMKRVKTVIILGSGGHTAEMIRILNHLNLKNYSPRIYVHADTDVMSVEKVKELEKDNNDYKIIKIRRSREIHQSYYTSVCTTIYAILESIPLLWTERPQLLLCNGPGTCVPLCIITFLFKVFYITQTTIVFIESFCRVQTLSLSGKILYYIADYLIVQWPLLSKPMYKKAIYI
ncbi:ALG14, UDP-N-acetylglucosaminyltransferase subunit [Nomia melanderi]|uniref:ALG14, UDP-N-acetylglucosaminyltransferase subunit n=1 Tax=Nomia melanderi TaxID=2448451 RepID=UPI001304769A|nr:UDP-N-acetylglucosamine transferase subunit ALG14 homolog [Nomia melanderi]